MRLCNPIRFTFHLFAIVAVLSCVASSGNGQSPSGRFERFRLVRGMNSPYRDTQPYVTSDGLTIFFTSDRPSEEASVDWTLANLWMATRESVSDSFGEPVILELPWETEGVGIINSTLSENETALYFFTGSGPGNGDGQIFVSKRESSSAPWGEPQVLGENINRPEFDNVEQFVTEDGLTMWFASAVDGDANYSLYEASRKSATEPFGNVTPLVNINTDDNEETDPTVSSNGLLLLFASNRDSFGLPELWAATRASVDNEFDDPMRVNEMGLGEINTPNAVEFAPHLSPDWPANGSKLYFGKAFGERDWDLYEATWSSDAPAGDLDGSGNIDAADVDFLTSAIRRNSSAVGFDLDSSGMVNESDLATMVETVLGTWVGDANLDGEFNSGDLVEVFQAGRYETSNAATWSQGDWNGDGVFDSGDFVTGFQGGGYEQGPRTAARAVPEPNGVLVLMVALAGIVIYRRR